MFKPAIQILALLILAGVLPAQDDLSWTTAKEPEVRERGLRELKAKKKEVPEALMKKLLRDSDWGVQLQAIDTFGRRPEPWIRDALVNLALRGELLVIRRAASATLADSNAEKSARQILKRMSRLGKKGKLFAIDSLGFVGSAVAVESLSELARSSNVDLCRAAIRSLAKLGAGASALIRGSRDTREVVALESVAALATIDSDDARDAMISFAVRKDEPWALRRIGQRGAEANKAVFALALATAIQKTRKPYGLLRVAWEGRLEGCASAARKHIDSIDPLTRAYAFAVGGLTKTPFDGKTLVRLGLRHRDERVRRAAARAAIEVGSRNDEAATVIIDLMAEKAHDVVMVAIRQAWDREIAECLPGLLQLATGKHSAKKSWELRCAAAVCAGRVGKLGAVETLLGLAKHRDWHVRAAAFEGLSRANRAEAIDVLIKAYNDRHQVPRLVARRNLHWMSGGRHYPKKEGWKRWWTRVRDGYEPKPPKLEDVDKVDDGGYERKIPRDYVRQLLAGTDITVILGRWDKVQFVLADLGVDHDLKRGQEVKDAGLWPKQTVCVNCEGSLDKTTNEFLRWMVVCGGYMATSDWALTNAVRKTFPDVIEGHVKQSTGNDVVEITSCAPGNPLLADIVHPHVALKWWLEIQAFPISIHDPIRTEVLVDSIEMRTRYGQDTMMATFPAGLGKILHTTSHFYLQQEGFAHAGSGTERQRYAIDHLGIPVKTVRDLVKIGGGLGDARNTRVVSREYSMFRMLVNFIVEKKRLDRR